MSEFDSIIISGSAIKEINGLYHHYHMEGRYMKKKVMTPKVYTHEKHENIHIKDTGFGFHEIINDGRLFGYIFMSPKCNSLYECSSNPTYPNFCYAYTATTINDPMRDTSPWYEFRDEGGKPYFMHKMTQERKNEIPDTTFHPYVNAERDTKPADGTGVYVLTYDPALIISPARVWVGGAGYKKKYKSKSRNLRSQKHTRNKKTRSKRRRVKSRRY